MDDSTIIRLAPRDFCEEQKREFAEHLLGSGTAVNLHQAEQIATITLDPNLSHEAKSVLLYLAHEGGADFELEALSEAEIAAACSAYREHARRIALAIMEPMGSVTWPA